MLRYVGLGWMALSLAAWGCGGSDHVSNTGSGDAGSEDADLPIPEGDPGMTELVGTLGALGDTVATVSSHYISNSGETLIYLTSAELTCDQLMVSRWLGAFEKGAQVVEIVIHGPPKPGTTDHDAEVNFAAGGKSSAYETGAETTTLKVTSSTTDSVIEGTVQATYKNGALAGRFHADFCAHGQGY